MTDEINYRNNPLHGVSLKKMLVEIVDHYGFEILFAYLQINCFKVNPSIESSVKFLKKTDWAREKVECFYLYDFKNLPNASSEQFSVSPRERIVPGHHSPGEPKVLSFEDAQRLHEKRAKKQASRDHNDRRRSAGKPGGRSGGFTSERSHVRREGGYRESRGASSAGETVDPWANARKKFDA